MHGAIVFGFFLRPELLIFANAMMSSVFRRSQSEFRGLQYFRFEMGIDSLFGFLCIVAVTARQIEEELKKILRIDKGA